MALLAERQRAGLATLSPEAEWQAADVLERDAQTRPLTRREAAARVWQQMGGEPEAA